MPKRDRDIGTYFPGTPDKRCNLEGNTLFIRKEGEMLPHIRLDVTLGKTVFCF